MQQRITDSHVYGFVQSGFALLFPELERLGRLDLAERWRRRLELPDRRANLSNSSKEDATRCLVWLGDLIDAEKLGGSAAGSDTLHPCRRRGYCRQEEREKHDENCIAGFSKRAGAHMLIHCWILLE